MKQLLNDALTAEQEYRTIFQSGMKNMQQALSILSLILDSDEYEDRFPILLDEKKFLDDYMELLKETISDLEKRSKAWYLTRGILRSIKEGGQE